MLIPSKSTGDKLLKELVAQAKEQNQTTVNSDPTHNSEQPTSTKSSLWYALSNQFKTLWIITLLPSVASLFTAYALYYFKDILPFWEMFGAKSLAMGLIPLFGIPIIHFLLKQVFSSNKQQPKHNNTILERWNQLEKDRKST